MFPKITDEFFNQDEYEILQTSFTETLDPKDLIKINNEALSSGAEYHYAVSTNPATHQTNVVKIDNQSNRILENPATRKTIKTIPNKNRRIYCHRKQGDPAANMYNTYDGNLHIVKDISEFTEAVELHQQWLQNPKQGHRLQLSPDFDWSRIQQLQQLDETHDKDVTFQKIKEQLYDTGFLLSSRTQEQIDSDNRQIEKIQKQLQKQADQKYYQSHQKQYPKGKKRPSEIGKINPEELEEKIQQYYLQNPQYQINLSGADLSNQNLSDINLSRINLSGADLSGSGFTRCSFNNSALTGADLENTEFDSCNMQETDLSETSLLNTVFKQCRLHNNNFHHTQAHHTNFTGSEIKNPQNWNPLWNKYAEGKTQNEATKGADPVFQDPENLKPLTRLSQIQLDDLMKSAHKKGQRPNLTGYDLSGLDFSRYGKLYHNDLSNINFNGSNLTGCDFTGMTLSHCDFSDCTIEHCNFNHTLCIQTSFDRTTGKNCTFDYAELSASSFTNARIPESSFYETTLNHTDFINTNLQSSAFQKSQGRGNRFQSININPGQKKKDNLQNPVNLSDTVFKSSKLNDTVIDQAVVSDMILYHTDLSGTNSSITNTPMQDVIMAHSEDVSLNKITYRYQQKHNMPTYDTSDTPSNQQAHHTRDTLNGDIIDDQEFPQNITTLRKQHQKIHDINLQSHSSFNGSWLNRQETADMIQQDISHMKHSVSEKTNSWSTRIDNDIDLEIKTARDHLKKAKTLFSKRNQD